MSNTPSTKPTRPRTPTHQWECVVTDTFAREFNYSWVRKHIVTARTIRGALQIVSRLSGFKFTTRLSGGYNTGSTLIAYAKGAAVGCAITWLSEVPKPEPKVWFLETTPGNPHPGYAKLPSLKQAVAYFKAHVAFDESIGNTPPEVARLYHAPALVHIDPDWPDVLLTRGPRGGIVVHRGEF